MDSLKLLFPCTCILLHILLGVANAQNLSEPFKSSSCDNSRGNYTSGSTYRRNLDSVLSSLTSDTKIDYGFYNLSAGQAPDQVNAIALCRGDISAGDCRVCIANATRRILEVCPNQKEAIIYHQYCRLRYSNRSIFHAVEIGPPIYREVNENNAPNVNLFIADLRTLLNSLQGIAAAGDSLKKLATGNETSGFYTIYGLVQCTPDLSGKQCGDCLVKIFSQMPGGGTKIGATVLAPSCNYRYEVGRFFALAPDSPPPSSPPLSPSPPPPEG